MKYILMMNGTKADWDEYAKWSKKDLEANVAFMRAFSKQLKDEGVLLRPRVWDGRRSEDRLRGKGR